MECRRCKKILDVKLPTLTFEDVLADGFEDVSMASELQQINFSEHVDRLPRTDNERFIIERFQLAAGNKVWFMLPKKEEIYRPGGSRDMFNELFACVQSGEIELQRLRLKNMTGRELTTWFGLNFGVPYETRMEMKNVPLEDAPPIGGKILQNMSEVVAEAVQKIPPFNEVLSIGNFSKMGMSWHDDGEDIVVGEVVASTSFGGLGSMSFALKDMYRTGRSPKGNASVPVYRGSLMLDERRCLQKKFEDGEITAKELEDQMTTLVKDLKARLPRALVRFPLPGTGAIMVQQGRTLNKIYLHEVDNLDPMRLVLTARLLATSVDTQTDSKA